MNNDRSNDRVFSWNGWRAFMRGYSHLNLQLTCHGYLAQRANYEGGQMIHAESVKMWEAETEYFRSIIAGKNAENAKLRAALEESVKLQSHYAMLLNVYDSGKRMQFDNADAWLIRLAALADEQRWH
jgi:Tfp pilus tip-associated adhesin PilY1